jgi:hypothetical protein
MEMNKLTRRLTAWIACFAVLLAALAPSISHAISAANGSGASWVEVCSLTGAKLVNVGDEQDPASSAPAEKGFHFEHCPFCSMHGGTVGLLPTAGFTLPVASGEQPLPSLFYQSPRPLFIWAAAQSRAPPAIS